MRLSPYLLPDLIVTELRAESSTETIQQLVARFADAIAELDKKETLDGLLSREKQVPTGLEHGIAIPHTTVKSIEKTCIGVARLSDPVDFGTQDGSLVQLVFMILSPQNDISTHIKLLARIARLCSDRAFVQSLMTAKDSKDLLKMLLDEDQRHV